MFALPKQPKSLKMISSMRKTFIQPARETYFVNHKRLSRIIENTMPFNTASISTSQLKSRLNGDDEKDFPTRTSSRSFVRSALGRANKILDQKLRDGNESNIDSSINSIIETINSKINDDNESDSLEDVLDVEIEVQNSLDESVNRAAKTVSPLYNDLTISEKNVYKKDDTYIQNDNEQILDLINATASRAEKTLLALDSSVDSNIKKESYETSKLSETLDSTDTITTVTNITTVTTTIISEKKKIPTFSSRSFSSSSKPISKSKDKRMYSDQPTVTSTALAHSLWSQILDPCRDTVIDATCGNGKDSLILANLLFPPTSTISATEEIKPELICIDIQARAVGNTTHLLQTHLPPNIMNPTSPQESYVRVLQMSHADNLLTVPKDTRSVGLICYNLGWLPGSGSDEIADTSKDISTEMGSTLKSLADATLLLREGGLLSVMTYPGSDRIEALAVSLFCETLAMFTSKEQRKKGGWETFIDEYDCKFRDGFADIDSENKYEQEFLLLKEAVKESVCKVWTEGVRRQTWRVFEHKSMGRPLSPILLTAMRIK